jgi:hypothetical protein
VCGKRVGCLFLVLNVGPLQVLVAHACYPSYSGGTDQEDQGWKLARQIVCETLPRKVPI